MVVLGTEAIANPVADNAAAPNPAALKKSLLCVIILGANDVYVIVNICNVNNIPFFANIFLTILTRL